MPLIVLASDKGAPGVTTTAVALAGVWPRRAILAECDPSGGDLVYRTPSESGSPLNPNVGMLSLATTARHGLSAHHLEQHLQRMQGGLEIITGLASGDQSTGLTGLWPALGRALAALPDADVIADCGRVEAASPVLDLMAAASAVVLVARASTEQIAHVRDRALSLVNRVGSPGVGTGLGIPIGVVLIVDPKQRGRVTAQVDELLRNSGLPVRVIGTIATDHDGADLINGRGRGRLDRTLLIRSAREVALDLYRQFAMPSSSAGAPQAAPRPPQQYGAQPMPQQGPGTPRPGQQGPAQHAPAQAPNTPAPPTAPSAGYVPSAPNNPAPPAPGAPNQPMFRRDTPAQPSWPGEQPPPTGSGHEGFGSATFAGGANPDTDRQAPQYPDDYRDGSEFDRLPPSGDLGSGGHHAYPPQGG